VLELLRDHWPEYACDGALLGLFMLSALSFGVALEHPTARLRRALPSPFARRALMGLAMGATAVALIYSPLGKRSGAHMNPATTLTFLRLGKVAAGDALFYVLAQFVGGLAGIGAGLLVWRARAGAPEVRYVATLPGGRGRGIAFLAEVAISFGLMSVVLFATNRADLAPYTGLLAGALVASYITVEAPLSGMSMNPARTLASAVPARAGRDLWIYFAAPLLGMLLAAEVRTRFGAACGACAKLQHDGDVRCIFCGAEPPSSDTPAIRTIP
jgi:aquaporin Z